MDILTSLRPVPESISYVFGGYVDMFWGGKHNLTEALIANKLYHRGYGIINLANWPENGSKRNIWSKMRRFPKI